MTDNEVVALMKSSKTEAEWNGNCDAVKKAFDGQCPSFWFPLILASGVMALTVAEFTK